VGEIAHAYGFRVPGSLHANKGFIGQIAELALGASAGSDPEPDFPALGIELKTLPIREDGRPVEATYVCHARLTGGEPLEWDQSHVSRKLDRVLFLPVVDDGKTPLAKRRFGMPFLWSPDASELAVLSADFRALQARVRMGESDDITTKDGVALHLRPKALSRHELTLGISDEGWVVALRPKAWYLRPSFTARIVARRFGLGAV
jgi:DNA mismatch repair protein MutH